MNALQIIAAQVIAGTTYSATLLRVNLKAFREEQAKKEYIMFKIIQVSHKSGDVKFFGHVHVGEFFMFNGTKYKKRSSRTAGLVDYASNRWFYFSSNDRCTITEA